MKILGDYHLHTRYSDGLAKVFDMVRAARERGLSEVAITEHGFGAWGPGLRRRNLERLRGDIESARAEMPVLFGIEANIVSEDGRIDLKDDERGQFDIVLLGLHLRVCYAWKTFFTFFIPNMFWNVIHWVPVGRIRKNTETVKKAVMRNQIDILAHPGRYFKVDVVEVAKICAERNTLMEINTKKISFRPVDFERMRAAGAKFIIGSDAHSVKRVGDCARAEEFLKNCTYDESEIINLKQTYTQYKNKNKKEKTADATKNKEPALETTGTQEEVIKRKRGWFKSK